MCRNKKSLSLYLYSKALIVLVCLFVFLEKGLRDREWDQGQPEVGEGASLSRAGQCSSAHFQRRQSEETHPSAWCFQDHLLKEGLAWLDSQAPGEAQYWLPALFSELSSRDVTPEEASQMTPWGVAKARTCTWTYRSLQCAGQWHHLWGRGWEETLRVTGLEQEQTTCSSIRPTHQIIKSELLSTDHVKRWRF